jgi:hypothetical protein
MTSKENQIARSAVRALLRELRRRRCDNFRVVGVGCWGKATVRMPGGKP